WRRLHRIGYWIFGHRNKAISYQQKTSAARGQVTAEKADGRSLMADGFAEAHRIRIFQHARDRLRRAFDDGNRAGVAHPRRPEHADGSNAGTAVVVGRQDEAERTQAGVQVLGADDDRQPGTVDVFVQQLEELLFLVDHLQERLQRVDGQAG